MEKLPIIFRAEKAGEFKGQVTAVFPTLPADYNGLELTCYAHIGQHSGGSFPWYWSTRAATPAEYASLLAELRGIYGRKLCDHDSEFELVPYKRMTAKHRAEFQAAVRAR